jgi:hypothetical protein
MKLKPCPFCGEKPQLEKTVSPDPLYYLPWNLTCCLIDAYFETKDAAIEAWNKRTEVEK